MRYTSIILLAFAFTVRADDKDELKKLEGTWEIIVIEADGKVIPPGKGSPEKLLIKDGKMTGFGPEVKLSTDASKKPKWLNITFAREGKDMTVNAVYELTGDELNINIPLAPKKGSGAVFENKRPEGFDTKDKAEMVLKAKRAK